MKRKSIRREGKVRASIVKKDRATKSHWSQIQWPEMESEFEIQSYLYWNLKNAGHNIRGEVSALTRSKFDLVVFSEDQVPIRIIEVKKHSPEQINRIAKKTATGRASKVSLQSQIRRYRSYKLPVDLVCGMRAAEEYVLGFRIDQPQLLPQEILDQDLWDGAMAPEDWVFDLGDQSSEYDAAVSFISQQKPKNGGKVYQYKRLSFRSDVCAMYVAVVNGASQVKCILELNHGLATEPDEIRQRREEIGRSLAAENRTYIIRINGTSEVRRLGKRLRNTGAAALGPHTSRVDKTTLEFRAKPGQGITLGEVDSESVDESFSQLVKSF